jgi:hypothetical protein
MCSWAFVLIALMFLAGWMAFNRSGGFDPYPFLLLNLVLSCLAALQGAILLIAAKRSDQIASEPARHDYEADIRTRDVVESLAREVAALRAEQAALHEQLRRGGSDAQCAGKEAARRSSRHEHGAELAARCRRQGGRTRGRPADADDELGLLRNSQHVPLDPQAGAVDLQGLAERGGGEPDPRRRQQDGTRRLPGAQAMEGVVSSGRDDEQLGGVVTAAVPGDLCGLGEFCTAEVAQR